LHIHPSRDREKPFVPAESTTIQRIEATALKTQQDRAFDHGQSVKVSPEPEKATRARKYTFGLVKAAETRGDFEVLAERHRRVLRVHLGAHVAAGLTTLKEAVQQALV
jgi:hypothetical protein